MGSSLFNPVWCDEACVPSSGEQKYPRRLSWNAGYRNLPARFTPLAKMLVILTKRTSISAPVIPGYNLLFYCMISGEKGTGMSARFVILIPRLVCQVTSFKSDTEVTFQFSVHQFDTESFPA